MLGTKSALMFMVLLTSLSCRVRDDEATANLAANTDQSMKAYTVTATMELLKPVDPKALQTSWQSATFISETPETVTYRVTVHPFVEFQKSLAANPNWRVDNRNNPGLQSYLAPGITTNWNDAMRVELIKLLKEDGINPEGLTDLELVQKVSSWLFTGPRFTYKSLFIPYYVAVQNGKLIVPSSTRMEFDREKNNSKISSDEEAIALGMLGKSMFERRVRGDCTASSILQATVLKALGIPTRIVVNVPIADANHPSELEMTRQGIRQKPLQTTLLAYLTATKGYWANHTFNEVYVGNQWTRLNYNRLAQPVVDKAYLGLMVQVANVSDWSEAHLETWGMHQVERRGQGFSVNPYRMLSIQDSNLF